MSSNPKKAKTEKEEKPFVETIYDFECSNCLLSEKATYFGKEPPFVKKALILTEDAYVIQDPFSPQIQTVPGQAKLPLILGAPCLICEKDFCVDCSIYYGQRFCLSCAKAEIGSFPPEVKAKIGKKLKKVQD